MRANMKFTLLAVVTFAAVLALVSADADAGYFIPKAFYKLDEEGHKLNLSPVSPHTVQYLRRLRRQVASSSSSSSTSASSDGGPVYFSSQQAVHHTPSGLASRFGETSGSAEASSSVGGSGGPVYFSTQTGVHHSGEPGIASRFGGSSTNSGTGKIIHTTGVVDDKGIVHYKTTTTNL